MFWEGSGGAGRAFQMYGRPSQRSGSGREALPMAERLGDSPISPRGVGRTSRRSGSGQEGLPKIREALLEVRKGSGGPRAGPGGSGGFGRCSQWSGRV